VTNREPSSFKWDGMMWPWVQRDLDWRVTANCTSKLQICLLVRGGTSQHDAIVMCPRSGPDTGRLTVGHKITWTWGYNWTTLFLGETNTGTGLSMLDSLKTWDKGLRFKKDCAEAQQQLKTTDPTSRQGGHPTSPNSV
jgi:hypothetical protein